MRSFLRRYKINLFEVPVFSTFWGVLFKSYIRLKGDSEFKNYNILVNFKIFWK